MSAVPPLQDLVGHTRTLQALVRAEGAGTTHHAQLFVGPAGVGKRTAAFGLAALMNCASPVSDGACGSCRHCRRILAMGEAPGDEATSRHPDVFYVTQPPGKTKILVSQVRELLKVVPFPPIEAPCRVVIIDPAERLGEEAANALLKTLEEPPSRTRFILVTPRPSALLTTIRSRCQRVPFGRLADAEVVSVLATRHGVDSAMAVSLASLADGSVGAALALLDDPVMGERDRWVRDFLGIAAGDALGAFAFAARVGELERGRDTVFELLARLLRDALWLRLGVAGPLFFQDLVAELSAWAGRYGVEALTERLELLGDTRLGLSTFHTNPRLTLERLILALTAPSGREGLRAVVPRHEVL